MFKEIRPTTDAIIDLIRTLPNAEQQKIVKTLSSKGLKKKQKPSPKKKEKAVLASIKQGLHEIKEAKRTSKSLKTLDAFLNEI